MTGCTACGTPVVSHSWRPWRPRARSALSCGVCKRKFCRGDLVPTLGRDGARAMVCLSCGGPRCMQLCPETAGVLEVAKRTSVQSTRRLLVSPVLAHKVDALADALVTQGFPNLLHISLPRCDLRDAARVKALAAGLRSALSLRAVDVSHCNMGDAGLAALLPALARAGVVESLNLRDNALSAKGARALAAAGLPRLRWLSLAGNPLGSDGLAALAAAAPSVEEINLTSVGAERVPEALALKPGLRVLIVAQNPIKHPPVRHTCTVLHLRRFFNRERRWLVVMSHARPSSSASASALQTFAGKAPARVIRELCAFI